jgi:hypothetical protein
MRDGGEVDNSSHAVQQGDEGRRVVERPMDGFNGGQHGKRRAVDEGTELKTRMPIVHDSRNRRPSSPEPPVTNARPANDIGR